MPLHDAWARITPFERLLPDEGFAERWFPEIRRELAEAGQELLEPGVLGLSRRAERALAELRTDDDAGMGPRHAATLFHALHHDGAGRPVLLVRTGVARGVADGDPGGAGGGLPSGAYVQLPQHLVWTPAGPDGLPLSVDGFFWTLPGDGSAHVMAVAGMTEGGDGFTVVVAPPAPLEDSATWAAGGMREGGEPDFATELPGADLEGLYEMRTAGELLELAARLDRYAALRPAEAGEPAGGTDRPRASGLPYRVLSAAEEDGDGA